MLEIIVYLLEYIFNYYVTLWAPNLVHNSVIASSPSGDEIYSVANFERNAIFPAP